MSERKEKIRQFWQTRAQEREASPNATTNDVYMRELEINTIIKTLNEVGVSQNSTVLDVGCGNGYSTIKIAKHVPSVNFVGIDFSDKMVSIAKRELEKNPELKDRITFLEGDVTDLKSVLGNETFDVVITDRVLINVETQKMQERAIEEIANHTKEGGYYIAIENFMRGQDNMNNARKQVGLPEIPLWWISTYFTEPWIVEKCSPFFENIDFRDFASSYYFATRVVYSGMCKMQGIDPDYNHEIHQLAINLPWTGEFSPVRLVLMKKRKNN